MQRREIDNETVLQFLETISVFRGLSREDLSAIAQCVIARSFDSGELIGDFGGVVDEFWIVFDGVLDTFIRSKLGELEPLQSIGPNDHLGEVSLLEKTSRPIRVTARTSGMLLAVPSDQFLGLVETYPILMRNLFRKLSVRFKNAFVARTCNTKARRLGIVAHSPPAQTLVARLIGRLAGHKERLVVLTDDVHRLRKHLAWPDKVTPIAATSSHITSEEHAHGSDRQIFVTCQPSLNNFDFRRFHECEEVLWMLEPHEASAVEPQLRRLRSSGDPVIRKLRLVWVLSKEQPVAAWLPDNPCERNSIRVHVLADSLQLDRLELQGLDRLVRAMRGYKIGIALAGGGAKGMAHLGVLRALDDAGITFDIMSGTSAGAMAGLFYASGIEPLKAAQYFEHDLTPSRAFRALPGWPNLYLLFQFRRRAWDAMLRPYFHDWRLEQLPIDFLSLTVDLVQGRSVVRKTGDAVQAILESINLPVISRPIRRDGMMLVDGGMLDNLPADVLTSNNCDFILGVDVSRKMNLEFAGNRPETPTKKMKNAGALATLFRIFEAQGKNLGFLRSQSIDFWITPDTSRFGMADFYKSQEIASVGEQAARKLIPTIQQRLAELEQRIFNPSAL